MSADLQFSSRRQQRSTPARQETSFKPTMTGAGLSLPGWARLHAAGTFRTETTKNDEFHRRERRTVGILLLRSTCITKGPPRLHDSLWNSGCDSRWGPCIPGLRCSLLAPASKSPQAASEFSGPSAAARWAGCAGPGGSGSKPGRTLDSLLSNGPARSESLARPPVHRGR